MASIVYTLKVGYRNEAEMEAKIGNTFYPTVEQAIAAAQAGDTILLMKDLTVNNAKINGTPNTGVYAIPAGVSVDGQNHTITADEATWVGTNANHIFVMAGGTAKIANVTLQGNANAKSGVCCYGSGTNITIENVTSKDFGNLGVIVAGATVVIDGLNTSGNAWGAVNADKGSDGSIPHVTFNSGTMAEDVEIYTEITDQDIITATGLTKYQGWGDRLKGFVFFTSDVNRLGIATMGDNKVAETVSLAAEHAAAGDTVTLLKDVTEEVAVPVGFSGTITGNHTITGGINCAATGAANTTLTLKDIVLEGGNTSKYGIISKNQTENGQMELNLTLENVTIQNFTDKAIYATNAKTLNITGGEIINCATGEVGTPNISGDYAVDLNLVAVQGAVVTVDGTTFTGDLGDKAVIKIAQRGGASDASASDIPKTVGEATVESVNIQNCKFNTTTPVTYNLGTSSKTTGDVENTSGAYAVTIGVHESELTVKMPYLTEDDTLVIPVGREATKAASDVRITLVATPEETVEAAIKAMEDAGIDVTDEGDKTFNLTTTDGTISGTGVFDKIAEIPGLTSIAVTNGVKTETYSAGGDLEAFKAAVDALLPKTNVAETVTLTMTIEIA